MNKEEQYLLFALSAPMEILNQGCKPAHDSPKMYTGIKEFDLSSSWGINNRDDLIQTIYQMTDDGHANAFHSSGEERCHVRYKPAKSLA